MSQQMRYSQGEQSSSHFNITSHSAPGGVAPGSPDSFGMDVLARSTDMEWQYGLLAGQDQFGDYIGRQPGPPRDTAHSASSLPYTHLMRDAPWDPLRANVPSKPGTLGSRSQGPYSYESFAFRDDAAALSDFGADSAYYSQSVVDHLTRKSVVESTYGDPDRGTETQSFVQPFSELHLHSQHSQGQDSVSVTGDKQWGPQPSPPNPEPASMMCPTCKTAVKTKAELNKHKLRHEKPFRCDVPNCPRKGQGFGTLNDLARHQQSVHRADGIKYRCSEGPCRTKQKKWPRADNFKQHLKRVHNKDISGDLDLSCYEIRIDDLAGLDTSEAQADVHAQQKPLSPWMEMDQRQQPVDPPSGEIDYSQLGAVSEASHQRGLVDDQRLSQQLDADNSEHQVHAALSDDHLHSGMHSALSRFGNDQNQAHDIRATGRTELYQDAPASRTSVLAPSDLVTPTMESRATGAQVQTMVPGVDAGYVFFKHKSQEAPRGEDLYVRDEQEQPLSRGLGHESTAGDGSHHESELARLQDEDDRAEVNEEPEAAEAPGDVRTLDHEHARAVETSIKPTLTLCAVKEPLPSEVGSVEESLGGSTPEESDVSATLEKLIGKVDKTVLDKIIAKFGYQKPKEEDAKPQEDAPKEPVTVEKEGTEVPCREQGCSKKFKRPCELKKHMKRHEKPYACTHSDCDKRFGSKNDWKRHENSQHIQLEFWKCTETVRDGSAAALVCNKICHRRETFKNHLEKDHGITNPTTIEQRCTDCRNGRNYESRFWCGFCKKTIEFGKNGGLAWSERFDHIDAHFTGKDGTKMDIKDWKSIEFEPAETFEAILPQEKRHADKSSSHDTATTSEANSDRALHSRKRRHEGGTPSSQSKRLKHGGSRKDNSQSMIWFCCHCNSRTFWQTAVTTRCLEAGCEHDLCSRCVTE